MRGPWCVQASSSSKRCDCTWHLCLKQVPISHYQADLPANQWLGQRTTPAMGYTIYFYGDFQFHSPIRAEHAEYLRAFSRTRRVTRAPQKLVDVQDPFRWAVGLPIGQEGAYYVGPGDTMAEQIRDPSVIEINVPPDHQPSLWCNWTVSEDNTSIVWDEGENFHCFTEWIEYLIDHFLSPWGYVINGEVEWVGEEDWDTGVICVENNVVSELGPITVREGDSFRPLRVFLSYAKEDKPTISQIYGFLDSVGACPWMDIENLLPGQDWEVEIEKAIEGADLVVVGLSGNSVDKRGYFQKEVAMTVEHALRQPEGRVFVIPLLLESCQVPRRLSKWQWLELLSEKFEQRLRDALIHRADELSSA